MTDVKIIQITALERSVGNTNIAKIFGLGEDGWVYEWSYSDKEWHPYIAE